MAYLCVDPDESEWITQVEPDRINRDDWKLWSVYLGADKIKLPKGSIRKLIGRDLTWEDEPVEL